MSNEFQREDRYIVIKRSDLKKVPVNYRSALVDPMFSLLSHLPHRECLVIEGDWPEYEPAWAAIEARVTGKPAEQHHGEPVALPSRMDHADTRNYDSPVEIHNATVAGWNACLDKIAKLGPLYTHADPGEVERLRKENENLRAGWYKDESDNNRFWPEEIEALRAELAERDALLQRALPYLSNTPDLVQHGAEDLAEEIRSASAGRPCYGPNEWGTECGKCSKCKHASAEPSAPVIHPINMKTMMQAYEQVDHKELLHGTSNWCASMATALRGVIHSEPSAPVERDDLSELALALNEYEKATGNHAVPRGFNREQDLFVRGFMARAALERKPK